MQNLTSASISSSVITEVIRVRGLTFTYPKSREPAVRGMDFSVGRGEIFGFLGPSGAGKSTTQKLLIGLLRGHGGEATVWGKDPLAWGPDYYQRIGVSFELPNHYQKLTGLENLRFFASLYERRHAGPDGAAGRRRPGRRCQHASRQVLQGNADAADLRPVADQRPGAALPRRAHLRAWIRSTRARSRTSSWT